MKLKILLPIFVLLVFSSFAFGGSNDAYNSCIVIENTPASETCNTGFAGALSRDSSRDRRNYDYFDLSNTTGIQLSEVNYSIYVDDKNVNDATNYLEVRFCYNTYSNVSWNTQSNINCTALYIDRIQSNLFSNNQYFHFNVTEVVNNDTDRRFIIFSRFTTENKATPDKVYWKDATEANPPKINYMFSSANLSVVITAPANNTRVSNNFTVNYTISGNTGITNCTIYINSTLNQTINNVSNSTTNNFTVPIGNDGIYNFFINCTDNSESFQTTSRTVIVDTTEPVINIYYPRNDNGTDFNKNNATLNLNIEISDDYLSQGNLTIIKNGTVYYNNYTGVISGNTSYTWNDSINMSSWPYGRYLLVVEATDALSSNNASLTFDIQPEINITGNYTNTGQTLIDFSIYANNTLVSSTSGSIAYTYLDANTTYNITFVKPGYTNSSQLLFLNDSDVAINFTLDYGTPVPANFIFPETTFNNISYITPIELNVTSWIVGANCLNISGSPFNGTYCLSSNTSINVTLGTGFLLLYFYDEETQRLIDYTNVSVVIFDLNSSAAVNYTEDSGSLFLTNIYQDIEIIATADGYNNRGYFASLSTTTLNTINIYLLNESSGTNVNCYVYDQTGKGLEDYRVRVQKRIGTSYKEVEISKTDFEGKAVILAEQYYPYYKFIVEKDGIIYKSTTETEITSTTLSFFINIGEDLIGTYTKYADLLYTFEYDNSTKQFILDYVDPSTNLSEICIDIYKKNNYSAEVLYSQDCLNTSSGTIYANITEEIGSIYTGYVFVSFSPEQYLDSIIVYFNDKINLAVNDAKIGLWLTLLLALIIAFVGLWNPQISLILMCFMLWLTRLIGLNKLDFSVIIGITVSSFVLGYLFTKR